MGYCKEINAANNNKKNNENQRNQTKVSIILNLTLNHKQGRKDDIKVQFDCQMIIIKYTILSNVLYVTKVRRSKNEN